MDVGEPAQLPAGLGDQLGAELGGHHPAGLLRQEPVARPVPAPSSRTRHPGGSLAIRTQKSSSPRSAQLGVVEGKDAVVVILDVGGHGSGLLQ